MVSAPVRRQQIAHICQRGLSIRRACALLNVAPSSWRYRSRLIERDAPARPRDEPGSGASAVAPARAASAEEAAAAARGEQPTQAVAGNRR
jgi:hypothetical protein